MSQDKEDLTILQGQHGEVRLRHMDFGYPYIQAESEIDLYYGLGYAHCRDRQMQMWLYKLIGQGRTSECLQAAHELIEADTFMRWIDLAGDAEAESARLPEAIRATLKSYCRGVNQALGDSKTRGEFRLVGYTPDAWTPADTLLTVKLSGLFQSQAVGEKFILQLIQNGLDVARLKELFPAIEEEISSELVVILKQVKLGTPVLPQTLAWRDLLPSIPASNNWVLAPRKTASGKAMLCGDPHWALQLPSTWYLATLTSGDFYVMGATLPGAPVMPLGRTAQLAWAPTYGTADVNDFYVEEVRDGEYRRGEEWLPLKSREDTLRPKKEAPIHLRFFETVHGPLESEPGENGFYLSFAWSVKHQEDTAAASLEQFFKLVHAREVEEAMGCFARMQYGAFNWVMADQVGDIGYQLSGLFPKKPEGSSGLLPYLGWEPSQDWVGMEDPQRYPRALNPPDGFIVTANQDLNALGQVKPMTLPMSSYRADRIRTLLAEVDGLAVDDMKRFHYDRYSLQAEAFMHILRPLLPPNQNGEILKVWDLCYTADSLGATLFERVHRELVRLVFGEHGVGLEVVDYVLEETLLGAILHNNFDRVLLQEESAWFDDLPRVELLAQAIERGLAKAPVPHAQTRKVKFTNLFFAGKLPASMGFDYPFEHIGSAATIPQSVSYKQGGRPISYAATLRLISDFSEEQMHANIAGGASDRRFSGYYTAGLKEWESGEYFLMRA